MTAVIDDVDQLLGLILDADAPPDLSRLTWRQIIDLDIAELRASGSLRGTFLDPFTDNDLLSPDWGWPGRGYCVHCWGRLGRRRRFYCSAGCRRAYERETRQTETEDYGRAVVRMVRGYGRRVAENDIGALGALAEVMAEAEAAMQAAVNGLRDRGVSWSEIGRELGVSRQGARQRWGHTGGGVR